MLLETGLFTGLLLWLRRRETGTVQCFWGAALLALFALISFVAKPYMYSHEQQLDEKTRWANIAYLVIGFLRGSTFVEWPNGDDDDAPELCLDARRAPLD